MSLRELLVEARRRGYAVPAINVVDVTTMDGVLQAARDCRSPVIIQTAAKTARIWGPALLAAAFDSLAASMGSPTLLQLDHCADTTLAEACLDAGWDAVLFDGSGLAVDHNIAATTAIVARARSRGAEVEGELEAFRGYEEGALVGGRPAASIRDAIAFIEATGIDCFAPAIGNIHGRTAHPVTLDVERVRELLAATDVPLALHGGTGIPNVDITEAIAAGCSKVNVSTALREACLTAARSHLLEHADSNDPVPLFEAVREAARTMAWTTMHQLDSAGRA